MGLGRRPYTTAPARARAVALAGRRKSLRRVRISAPPVRDRDLEHGGAPDRGPAEGPSLLVRQPSVRQGLYRTAQRPQMAVFSGREDLMGLHKTSRIWS